ncbi:MAG TPA: dihydrodipicolinate synthase family protein, partial [Anaerolineales bacterium]|nr:dihydrodipicolinate synthase family protein [Anaerolineales bacterium]
MNQANARSRLCGCYVTIPTLFQDSDLSVDLEAIRRHVRFVIEGGITTGNGVLLAGGAAGDFSTMTFDERLQVAAAVYEEARGRVPVVLGAQSTSTLELVRLAKAAEKIGIEFIQVSPPYYFAHTEDDFYEYVLAAAGAADIGLIIYNTFWTSYSVSTGLVEKLRKVPNVIGLKWSMPDMGNMEFEQVISRFSPHFSIIDNQMRFVTSHMLGARGIEVHVCNYWPQWGVRMWKLLEGCQYIEAQRELVKVAMP